MPVAAVPKYLGADFESASPGMRFGMYLGIWTDRADQVCEVKSRAKKKSPEADEIQQMLRSMDIDSVITVLCERDRNPLPRLWEKSKSAADKAWSRLCEIRDNDRATMRALAGRQQALAAAVSEGTVLRIEAHAVAPFTTGLGNEHPLENGFAFLWPYGLPYLPGSGVKGVVSQAARELARGRWGDPEGWSEDARYVARDTKGKLLVEGLSMLDVLFGKGTEGGEKEHFRGVLTFWDVIPQIEGEALRVEIMTPHQKHYYQDGQPPHDCGEPTPIHFLTVPPGSRFSFYVVCDEARLARIAPDLAADGRWRTVLEAAFEHAFEWLGFGAKTAVGYGAMARRDEKAQRPDEQPGGPRVTVEESEERWDDATVRFEPGPQLLTATGPGGRRAIARGKAAVDALLEGFRESRLKRLKGGLRMAVRVRRKGNQLEIVSLER